ncbi:MAG: site-specific integrase [Pseudomonadota bacterium]
MSNYRLRRPGAIRINGKPTDCYYITWTEGSRSRRKSTGTDDEIVARRWMAEFIAAMDAPPEAFTIGDMVSGYLQEAPDQGDHAKAVMRLLGHLSLPSLTRSQVRMFHTSRRGEGASNSTIARQCGVLRAAIQWAYKERWITLDEVPHIEAPRAAPARNRFLTYEEATDLYAAAHDRAAPHMRAFIALALWTGQRAGAILDLKWSNVDWERGLIYFDGGNATKRRAAAVGMNWPLALTLANGFLIRDCTHIVSYGGKPVKSVKKAFARCVQWAGLEDVRQHDLRRTAASWMLQNGGTFEDAAQLLADDIRTVQRHYGRFAEQNLLTNAERIAR